MCRALRGYKAASRLQIPGCCTGAGAQTRADAQHRLCKPGSLQAWVCLLSATSGTCVNISAGGAWEGHAVVCAPVAHVGHPVGDAVRVGAPAQQHRGQRYDSAAAKAELSLAGNSRTGTVLQVHTQLVSAPVAHVGHQVGDAVRFGAPARQQFITSHDSASARTGMSLAVNSRAVTVLQVHEQLVCAPVARVEHPGGDAVRGSAPAQQQVRTVCPSLSRGAAHDDW